MPSATAAGQTSVLPSNGGPPRERWYHRAAARLPAARYIALIVVGIAVVGGGIAFGITQLSKDDGGSATEQTAAKKREAKERKKEAPPAIEPGDVSVAVFNGTTVEGLARTIGSRLQGDGFEVGNLVTASDQQAAESVVLFKEGANREAALVAKQLDISQIEPADAETLAQAGGAEVIVLAGADLAQQ